MDAEKGQTMVFFDRKGYFKNIIIPFKHNFQYLLDLCTVKYNYFHNYYQDIVT